MEAAFGSKEDEEVDEERECQKLFPKQSVININNLCIEFKFKQIN